ncbi:hypothetical protein LCGC14_2388830, partial [marine sediment metagenome]
MTRRLFIAGLSALLVFVLVVGTALAATWEFKFPTTTRDIGGVGGTTLPVLLDYGAQPLVDAGYIAATGLDTNMQLGITDLEYMLTTTQVATVIPNLPANGLVTTNLYTGYDPIRTNFPVIPGENGLVGIEDDAALELVNNFEVEFDGYIDTTETSVPLVYKPGGFLTEVSAAGTITAGIINVDSYDVTPGVFGAWTDVNVSVYIPEGTSGVIIEVDSTNAVKETGFRKNGSTDARVYDGEHSWIMIGVDSSGIFEAYLEDNNVFLYIRGYTDDNWVFNTNAVDISVGAFLAWTDIDVSAITSSDATGVIVEVVNVNAGVNKDTG